MLVTSLSQRPKPKPKHTLISPKNTKTENSVCIQVQHVKAIERGRQVGTRSLVRLHRKTASSSRPPNLCAPPLTKGWWPPVTSSINNNENKKNSQFNNYISMARPMCIHIGWTNGRPVVWRLLSVGATQFKRFKCRLAEPIPRVVICLPFDDYVVL